MCVHSCIINPRLSPALPSGASVIWTVVGLLAVIVLKGRRSSLVWWTNIFIRLGGDTNSELVWGELGPVGDELRGYFCSCCNPWYSPVLFSVLSSHESLTCVSPVVPMPDWLEGTSVHEFHNLYSPSGLGRGCGIILAVVPMRKCLGEHFCTSPSFPIALLS